VDEIRQGDVMLKPVTNMPRSTRLIPRKLDGHPEVKGIVLAAGAATGHHHVVADPYARLFESLYTGERYLRVSRRGAMLTHEEHDPLPLERGDYAIQRQREYEPPSDPRPRSGRPRSSSWGYVRD